MNQFCYGERERVYRMALKIYGQKMQEVVAIEEMSEVIKEVCKMQRGEGSRGKLAEEIADATIMLEQLRMMYGIDDEVSSIMDQKIVRLSRKVQEDGDAANIWLFKGGDPVV